MELKKGARLNSGKWATVSGCSLVNTNIQFHPDGHKIGSSPDGRYMLRKAKSSNKMEWHRLPNTKMFSEGRTSPLFPTQADWRFKVEVRGDKCQWVLLANVGRNDMCVYECQELFDRRNLTYKLPSRAVWKQRIFPRDSKALEGHNWPVTEWVPTTIMIKMY